MGGGQRAGGSIAQPGSHLCGPPGAHPCLLLLPPAPGHQPDRYINGKHYSRTLEDWLKLHDANRKQIMPLFEQTYGKQVSARHANTP